VATVTFEGVWKKFLGGERHDSLRDLIPAAVKALTRRATPTQLDDREFWALEDVSFIVPPGQALGILGPNGAGKSTTLKLLTKILRPTRGRSAVSGRVGALIEVAAGFHPDLTGRENTYLQGAVMGMKRAEVAARFEEIVEFAGIGEFIDTPIKRYSSGMNARLGFSIAAHLRPDVLIIDEVLSVGDMKFQERCVERMRSFKRDGVTIVFVSHNLQAISDLCDRALYLNRRPRLLGPVDEVIGQYVRDSFSAPDTSAVGGFRVVSAQLQDQTGQAVTSPVRPSMQLRFVVRVETLRPFGELIFAFRVLRSTDQLVVYDGHFSQAELGLRLDVPGCFEVSYGFTANLTRGEYFFDVFAQEVATQRFLGRMTPAGHLTVVENRTWGGVADLSVAARAVHPSDITVTPVPS